MAERIAEKTKPVSKKIKGFATIWGGALTVRHSDTCRRPGETTAEYNYRRRKRRGTD